LGGEKDHCIPENTASKLRKKKGLFKGWEGGTSKFAAAVKVRNLLQRKGCKVSKCSAGSEVEERAEKDLNLTESSRMGVI